MMKLFRGDPRLLINAAPWAIVVVVVKGLLEWAGVHPLELSTLLPATITAEVFIIGFLLAGTSSDYKEAEHLPGEISASLETIADECLITAADPGLPEAQQCLAKLVEISHAIRQWLLHNHEFSRVMADLRSLNDYFIVFGPRIQPGFTTRLKSEQAAMRKVVLRMDTIRRTSYVRAAYTIAEATAVVLVIILLMTDLGSVAPTLSLIGTITYLLVYMLTLIRDLDNPFDYAGGKVGGADVSLEVLELTEERLRALLVTMS
jgi:hypothetical protein